ncbi:MAG: SusC/RagA family TonB-linked outer membrane protein [Chitinophagaceae bacterium]|nr:SusC/RagA family TonB-linked outer membrane protein [Chitinophagaceae bacterium]
MKLTFLLLLTGFLTARGNIYGQQFSIDVKNQPLEAVCSTIEKQSNYVFLLNSTVDKAAPVTANIKSDNIQEVLKSVLKELDIDFIIKGKTIILARREKKEKRFADQSPGVLGKDDPIEVVVRVTNEEGEPVAGVTVQVKGGKIVGATNGEGVAIIKVSPNAALVLTAVNIIPVEKEINGQRELSILVNGKTGRLDEVQVIAYGTSSQRYNAGNVASVKASEIAKQPVNNPLLTLQGRVPGLFITQNSGVPGGGITVRIQGQNSIGNGNDPLYVIDGVPYESQLSRASDAAAVLGESGGRVNPFGNPLSFINPADIESIDILKDADATAIYGSRAANGAILITTKKGKAGKAKFDLNFQQGWGEVTRKTNMLNRRQYLDMRYEAYKNEGTPLSALTTGARTYDLKLWDTTRSTDWQDQLIGGTAAYTNANATFSGGTSLSQFLIGGTYQRETTVFPGDFENQKAALHFNFSSTSLNQRFRLLFSGNYMIDNNRLPGMDLTQSANLLEPVAPPLYNEDGSLNWAPAPNGASSWTNPLIYVLYRKYNNKTNNLLSNLQLGFTVLKGLEVKASFGYTNLQSTEFFGSPLISVRPENRTVTPRSAVYGNRLTRSWIVEPQVSYKKSISKGVLEVLLGSSIQQSKNNSGSLNGQGYSSDQLLEEIKAATLVTVGNSFISAYKYNAVFGRLNYKWQGKYVVNLNARRDGSSRFGSNNRFHNFGSVAGAWIFTEESFLKDKLNFFSFGKIRASYGTAGNDQIDDYQFLNLYGIINGNIPGTDIPYQNVTGLLPGSLPNPNLQWEETKKMQVGIDLAFFKDRIIFAGTYSNNRSSNQLLQYNLPTYSGNNYIVSNFPATVENKSWEFSLSSVNLKSNSLEWTTNINLTIPRNKLIRFPNLEESTYAGTLEVGEPLFPSRLFRFAGVDPSSGLYQVVDKDGKLTTTPSYATDRTVLVNTLPEFYGGFQNRVVFKGFEIDFLFQFIKQKGANILFNNGTATQPGFFASGSSNQPTAVLQRWQRPGDIVNIQRYSPIPGTVRDQLSIAQASDAAIEDASFIRLKNASVSWRLPTKWQQAVYLQNCRIYALAQNLITITNYKGADPENKGFASLPPLRMITAGIQVGF